jgi:hypothetical protein
MSSPRKKVRGWRRRLEQFDVWARGEASKEIAPPNSVDYESAEFWFGHWHQPFPLFAKRRIVQHLVDIHDAWHAQRSRFDSSGLYLGIWLFEPVLLESQVVLAGEVRGADYLERHDPSKRSPPPSQYQGRPYDLSRFEWTHHVWRDREPLSELAGYSREAALRDAVKVETVDGETYVTFERHSWYAMLPRR